MGHITRVIYIYIYIYIYIIGISMYMDMDMGTVYNYIVISVGVVYLPGPKRKCFSGRQVAPSSAGDVRAGNVQ